MQHPTVWRIAPSCAAFSHWKGGVSVCSLGFCIRVGSLSNKSKTHDKINVANPQLWKL